MQSPTNFTEDESTSYDLGAVFQIMKKSTPLLKYGRIGKPHFRYFNLDEKNTKIKWVSQKKSADQTEIDFLDMIKLVEGQSSDVFAKNKSSKFIPDFLSFSIYYYSKDGSIRTLDLVCKVRIMH